MSLGTSSDIVLDARIRLSPDEIDSPHSYSAKRDMWNAGLLLIQLLLGPSSLGKYPNLPVLLQNGLCGQDCTS